MRRMVMRRMIGLGIYRLDINSRESAVVGIVGGGGIGANTISRWEAGRLVQNSSMDVLLRLIRDVPQNIRYLRGHAA